MKDMYIYGRNAVIEVIKDGRAKKLYLSSRDMEGSINKIYALAREKKIPLTKVDGKKLDELAEGGRHQGVIALVNDFEYAELDDILKEASSVKGGGKILILDGIQDSHNLGACARSAYAAGFTGIIIQKHRSAQVNEGAYKASAGAIENIKVARVTNISKTIEILKKENYWIYGLDMEGEKYYKTDLRGNIALVVGNEAKGISDNILKACDGKISIPMTKSFDSLNASCAASIVVFEVQRQCIEDTI
ncbi:23S rRNA (guanosine(2251)-2'-O)-methyltransferase RlmB [Peptoniphilus sp. GNH]|nr:RNA methyltransferase, TrmH family, group 3 [Clostridiales bacterium KA00134]UHR02299.1 23S rRNA (guanosine(2251)-2'-O)-methyltransferase RlmB [Peptoniphilus sp. GNH]